MTVTHLLAIDPGPEQSGWALIDISRRAIVDHGVSENVELLTALNAPIAGHHLVCEKIASYGMAVGESVFETCVWTGHFISAFTRNQPQRTDLYSRITRTDVKLTLCHQTRGVKDAIVNQRLKDLWGEPGRKKTPGPTFGFTNHAWAALAVATAWMLQHKTPGTESWHG